jgi:hypothetical protein
VACGGFNLDARGLSCAAVDEFDHACVVDGGVGVCHGDDGGEAAAGGGTATGLDGFFRFKSWLSEMDVNVDESWGYDASCGVDFFFADESLAELGD